MTIFEYAIVREASQLAGKINKSGAQPVLAMVPSESRGRELLLLLESAQRIADEDPDVKGHKAAMDEFASARLTLQAAGVTTAPPKNQYTGLIVRTPRAKAPKKEFTLNDWFRMRAGGSH